MLGMKPALVAILVALAGCAASNTPQGTADGASPDGTSTQDDGGSDPDGSPIDGSAIDATPIDGSAIDGSAIDADPTAIDAMPIDSSPIDAMPIDGSTCPTTPCDLVAQCGCGTNQACDIDFTDLMGTACRGVATAGDQNDTCTAINQCGAGYVCVGDGTNNTCEQYCDADADCGSPRGQCVIQLVDNAQAPIPGAVTCSSNCDPASATNAVCPTGWGCDLYTATFNNVAHDIVDCRAPGARTQGQTCDSTTNICAAGLTCVNDGTANVCGQICRRPAGTECTNGTTCYGFGTAFVVGGQEYGVCL